MSIRSKMSTEMSDSMDDPTEKVVIVATTSLPYLLDSNFLRRFPRMIYVKLPNHAAVLKILKDCLNDFTFANDVSNDGLSRLAAKTASEGAYSGYDITRAIKLELRHKLQSEWISASHFREASA